MEGHKTFELGAIVPGMKDCGALVPYFQTVPIGYKLAGAYTIDANSQFYAYSAPVKEWVILHGFNASYLGDGLKIQVADKSVPDVMIPFFSTPFPGVVGSRTQAEPVRSFAMPYVLPPGHRLQFFVQNTTVTTQDRGAITMVGVRFIPRDDFPCFN